MEATKLFNTPYTVTYIDMAGETHTTTMFWNEDAPTDRDVAIVMRHTLLGEFPPIPDKDPKDREDTTVRQLRLAGFTNFKVERAQRYDMDSAQAIENLIQQDMDSESVVEELIRQDLDSDRVAEDLVRQDQMNMAKQLMQDDAAVLRTLAKK